MMIEPEVDPAVVAARFAATGSVRACWPMALGHINPTWRVLASNGAFVLQCLNSTVFRDPEQVIRNTVTLTNTLRAQHFPMRLPELCLADDGEHWCWQAERLWRLYPFIPAAASEECTAEARKARAAGTAFGLFLAATATLDETQIKPVIPDFHNLAARLAAFDSAAAADRHHRLAMLSALLDDIAERRDLADVAMQTEATLRVVHNDAKLSNLLFSASEPRAPVALIDLDTVMAGMALYDFGDLVRSCTDASAEDAVPGPPNPEALRAVTQGYIQACGASLSDAEIRSLLWGPVYITFMLAIRFLTDFLQGDRYFPVQDEQHNLRRAQSQLQRLRHYEANQEFLAELLEPALVVRQQGQDSS